MDTVVRGKTDEVAWTFRWTVDLYIPGDSTRGGSTNSSGGGGGQGRNSSGGGG